MNNLKVTVKILILVAISIVGMLFVGYRGYSSIDNAAVELDFLYARELQSVNMLGSCTEKMRTIQVRSMQAIADPSRCDEVKKSQAKDIASFEEEIKGSLEPGKLADYVILSASPYDTATEDVPSILVEKTFIGGEEVYSR